MIKIMEMIPNTKNECKFNLSQVPTVQKKLNENSMLTQRNRVNSDSTQFETHQSKT